MTNIFKVKGDFKWPRLAAALAVTLGAGLIGALFSRRAGEIYEALVLPSFAPPFGVFLPAWIALYALMSLCLCRILMRPAGPETKNAVFYFSLQLLFGVLWSLLFFTLQLRLAAFVDLVILLFYMIAATLKFFKIDKAAGILMIPCLLWAAFAGILNFMAVLLNG